MDRYNIHLDSVGIVSLSNKGGKALAPDEIHLEKSVVNHLLKLVLKIIQWRL